MHYQENKTYTTKYRDQYIDYTYFSGANDSDWFVVSYEEYQRLKSIFVQNTNIKDPAWFIEDLELTIGNDISKRLDLPVDDVLSCVYVKYTE